jgi:hypothetical protein
MIYTRRESIIGAGAALGFLTVPLAACVDGASTITFANPAPVWWNAVPLVAAQRGFYSAEGVTVLGFDVPTGVASKQAIIDGNAVMGVAAPNAISTSTDAELNRLKILGTLTQSANTIAILTRGLASNFLESRIGYVRGTVSEFYLIAYLAKIGQLERYHNGRLDLVNLPPPNLVTAFERRDIDTAVAWEPFGSQIQMLASSRGRIEIIRDETLYTQHIFALASSDLEHGVRDRVITALRKTAEFITANRPTVAADLERYFRFPSGFLSRGAIWPNVHFRFSQDRAPILQALNRDLDLAREAGVARSGGGPSFAALLDQLP